MHNSGESQVTTVCLSEPVFSTLGGLLDLMLETELRPRRWLFLRKSQSVVVGRKQMKK